MAMARRSARPGCGPIGWTHYGGENGLVKGGTENPRRAVWRVRASRPPPKPRRSAVRGGKQVTGRNRPLVGATLGLLIAVVGTAANTADRVGLMVL